MILVTVGTHEAPFDRLVTAAEVLAAGEPVVLQKGTSRAPTPRCQASATLTPAELDAAMAKARIVVCHAGPTTMLEAAAHGHVPIVVPRQAAFGEHVDDHQLHFARRMADRVHVVEHPGDLPGALERHHEIIGELRALHPDGARTRRFASDLEALCLAASRAPRRRGSVRDRLRALRTWMNHNT